MEDLSLQSSAREHELQRRIDVISRRLQSNLPPGGPQQFTVAADTASIPNLALLAEHVALRDEMKAVESRLESQLTCAEQLAENWHDIAFDNLEEYEGAKAAHARSELAAAIASRVQQHAIYTPPSTPSFQGSGAGSRESSPPSLDPKVSLSNTRTLGPRPSKGDQPAGVGGIGDGVHTSAKGHCPPFHAE